MHKGVCVGGPMAGLTLTTRSNVGFVAVDRPASAAWLYRADDAGRFVLDTADDPSRIDDDGTRALDLDRIENALASCLDVIAVPDDGEDVEEPGEPVEISDDDDEPEAY